MIVTGLVGALIVSSYKWGLWTFGTVVSPSPLLISRLDASSTRSSSSFSSFSSCNPRPCSTSSGSSSAPDARPPPVSLPRSESRTCARPVSSSSSGRSIPSPGDSPTVAMSSRESTLSSTIPAEICLRLSTTLSIPPPLHLRHLIFSVTGEMVFYGVLDLVCSPWAACLLFPVLCTPHSSSTGSLTRPASSTQCSAARQARLLLHPSVHAQKRRPLHPLPSIWKGPCFTSHPTPIVHLPFSAPLCLTFSSPPTVSPTQYSDSAKAGYELQTNPASSAATGSAPFKNTPADTTGAGSSTLGVPERPGAARRRTSERRTALEAQAVAEGRDDGQELRRDE